MRWCTDREQRNYVDVFAGMMFYFLPSTSPVDQLNRQTMDVTVPWMVIGKEIERRDGSDYFNSSFRSERYLLLGHSTTLRWHTGNLGWIRRIADPVWEERYAEGWGLTGLKCITRA